MRRILNTTLLACLSLSARFQTFSDIDLSQLTAEQGIKIIGPSASSFGQSLSHAGDINGDGIHDFMIAAIDFNLPSEPFTEGVGAVFVIFGTQEGFPPEIDLQTGGPALGQGFKILGLQRDSSLGTSLKNLGDVNGDKKSDIIISEPGFNNYAGIAYVIFGTNEGFPLEIDLNNFTEEQGFIINGATGAVSGAGDINNDGVNDIMIGVLNVHLVGGQHLSDGAVYVIYGGASLSNINLDGTIDPAKGFIIAAESDNGSIGSRISSAGDINGDEINDIVISAPFITLEGIQKKGRVYVIFGKNGNLPNIDLINDLSTNNQGFAITGDNSGRFEGLHMASVGDINGDKVDDLIIGTERATPGHAYVIYGNKNSLPNINLADGLDIGQGFKIIGASEGRVGVSMSGLGDIDGDGIHDFIVGANFADPLENGQEIGAAYVIFGSKTQFPEVVDVTDSFGGMRGFKIYGSGFPEHAFGNVVSSAGDVNGDGAADILLGIPNINEAYVLFSPTPQGICIPEAI